MPSDYVAFCEIEASRVNEDPELYRILLVGDKPTKGFSGLEEEFEVEDSASLDKLAKNLITALKKVGSPQVEVKNIAQDVISCDRCLGVYETILKRKLNADELLKFYNSLHKYWEDVKNDSG